MTKLSKKVNSKISKSAEVNYMGGTSYKLSSLETLKMVLASSIFGEPKYYIPSKIESTTNIHPKDFLIRYNHTTVESEIESIIDKALGEDFKGVLDFVVELRKNFYMRMNPAVILVRAAVHPKREEFTRKYPAYYKEIVKSFALRPDDLTNMVEYFLFLDKKKTIPSVMKRAIANSLEEMKAWQIEKYQNRGIGLIDVVRLVHANNETIDSLMRNGKIQEDEFINWKNLRSSGVSWDDILKKYLNLLSHDDILNQMINIANSVDIEMLKNVLQHFITTAKKSKIFPYRYLLLTRLINQSSLDDNKKEFIKSAIESALVVSLKEQPRLKGKTAILVDNSGSARHGLPSVESNATIADIGNLSASIIGSLSDEADLFVFGNKLEKAYTYETNKGPVSLTHVASILDKVGNTVGQDTENGIWLFYKEMLETKTVYDNIFILSDMQAGQGELYGINEFDYKEFCCNSRYIDIHKLTQEYRRKVNPKVNYFSVQIAGYKNSILPQYIYRGANLYGWTGKEAFFASKYIDMWQDK